MVLVGRKRARAGVRGVSTELIRPVVEKGYLENESALFAIDTWSVVSLIPRELPYCSVCFQRWF